MLQRSGERVSEGKLRRLKKEHSTNIKEVRLKSLKRKSKADVAKTRQGA